MMLSFFKYQGTGNDFIMVDNREHAYENQLSTDQVAWLCDRRFGIGADGLILLSGSDEADFRMIYYNSDGRESSMCGNGGRCIAAFARQLGIVQSACAFDAIDGRHEAEFLPDGQVRLKMGNPSGYRVIDEQTVWLDTGSPHYVAFKEENLNDFPVNQEGRRIRNSPPFSDGGTNVNFVKVLGDAHLRVRTYERGVEAETLSCGTGVTACAYAQLSRRALANGQLRIETEGGTLKVEVHNRATPLESVYLIGPASFVFEGKVDLPGNPGEHA